MAKPKLPLQQSLKAQEFTEREILGILRDTGLEAGRFIAEHQGSARAAQIEMAQQQIEMWASIKDHIMVGIGDQVDAAGLVQSVYDEEFMRSSGISSRYWRMSTLRQARAGIDNLRSRRENGLSLSERVYRNRVISSGKIDRILNTGIALGKSAREIAKDVEGFIRPDVPGGASYAAMRLGRTELNNAFHTTQQRMMLDNPFVERAKWHLSGSHPRPDECNDYADSVQVLGWEAGEFAVADVPPRPHPNCLCYISPVMMDIEKAKQQFKQGQFDTYLDGVGCGRVV